MPPDRTRTRKGKGSASSLAEPETDSAPLEPLTTDTSTSASGAATARHYDRTAALEARCQVLEARLEAYAAVSQSGGSTGEPTTSARPDGSFDAFAREEWDYRLPYRSMTESSRVLDSQGCPIYDEREFTFIDPDGYPSALQRGLLSEYHFDFAFTV